MVIHIPNDVMEKAQSDSSIQSILKFIFSLFERNKHSWYVMDDDDVTLYEVPFLDSYRDFIKKRAVQSMYEDLQTTCLTEIHTSDGIENKMSSSKKVSGTTESTILDGRRVIISTSEQTLNLVTIDLVETYLGEPLKILVENRFSDRLFLETCMKHVGSINVGSCWIDFVHGGGNTLIPLAEDLRGRNRVLCIVDSDKEHPDDQTHQQKWQELQRVCEEYGYLLHILEKREIENYLPDEALQEYLRQHKRDATEFEPYFQLPNPIKDYVDIKKGTASHHLLEQAALSFEMVAPTSDGSNQIMPPFGRKIWEAFQYVKSREELETRDLHGELEEMVDKIKQLL